MADEFQSGICSGSWWNSNRNSGFNGSSSPCSTAITDVGFGWGAETASARSCEESAGSVSGSSSIIFQDAQKVNVSESLSGSGVLMDSTLQMAGFGVPSPIDWSQALLRSSGRAESNFHSMLQEDLSSRSNFRQDMQLDSKNFSTAQDSPINAFKQLNHTFSLDQNRLNSAGNSSGDCPITSQSLPRNSLNSFPTDSASYGCPPTYLHGLFDAEHQPQESAYENRSINYPSQLNYRMNSNEFQTSWPLKSSSPKPQPSNQLHFSNNALFWNASAGTMSDVGSSFYPSSNAQFLTQAFEEKPNCSSLAVKPNAEEVRDSCSATKKSSNEPAFKRPRIETPSPLPTFKVRKEKLGDRITALQQLVAPFGKTDTASVLYEAIDYIKFLHEQVSVLSTPYMKNGAPMQHQQISDISVDAQGPKQDLRSRGLCLVPISSTFPVTDESASDFWSPTFGGTFR